MRIVAGVMGPGADATTADCRDAYELGGLIARAGWVTLTGGRRSGVMDAALKGALDAGGLTVGVLPHDDPSGDISSHVEIPILTGVGEARNVINILSSRVVFVCGMSAGTASEVAFALKLERLVILVNPTEIGLQFWASLRGPLLRTAGSPADAMGIAREQLTTSTRQVAERR